MNADYAAEVSYRSVRIGFSTNRSRPLKECFFLAIPLPTVKEILRTGNRPTEPFWVNSINQRSEVCQLVTLHFAVWLGFVEPHKMRNDVCRIALHFAAVHPFSHVVSHETRLAFGSTYNRVSNGHCPY